MKKLIDNATFQIMGVMFILALIVSCGTNKTLTNPTARETYQFGREKYDNKKFIDAIEKFQSVIYNYPGDAIVDTAQYYLGMSYYHNEDYKLASTEFNRLAINYPSSPFFERAIYMKAVALFESTPDHYGLDQTELYNAIDLFEDFLIDFPESDQVEGAREHLLAARTRLAKKLYKDGIIYDHIRAYESAKIYFQKVIDDYTDTKFVPNATYQLALMEYKLKNYEKARTKFQDFMTVFPNHELVSDVREKVVESAFEKCEQYQNDEDSSRAVPCWEKFRVDFPNSDKYEKAGEYLDEFQQGKHPEPQEEHADH
ncbi:MAG: outer membrane protein assembly factor BamD [candidate division Zixibacteria bacterium]|nr:outer membrane protein assembly factor BamD [candidate division Zixibacteria bacterium]